MPRGVYKRKPAPDVSFKAIEARTQELPTSGITAIVPARTFVDLPWWHKLNATEQAKAMEEGQKLAAGLLHFGQSRMAIARALTNLHNILEPHRVFDRFLHHFHFSKRTAYRYITALENAAKDRRMNQLILDTAMARGLNLMGEEPERPFGIYTETVNQNPPPNNPTPEQAVDWLSNIDKKYKEQRSKGPREMAVEPPGDPDTLAKEVVRFAALRYKQLPPHSHTRGAFIRRITGMLLTMGGFSSAQSIEPEAIPDTFVAKRGRPRLHPEVTGVA